MTSPAASWASAAQCAGAVLKSLRCAAANSFAAGAVASVYGAVNSQPVAASPASSMNPGTMAVCIAIRGPLNGVAASARAVRAAPAPSPA